MKIINRINGLFLLFEGILIICWWTQLFITEGIEKLFINEIPSSIFHLTSESMLAIFCIITSIGLFRNTDWSKKFVFFNFGFFICSVVNAGSLYVFNKEYYDLFKIIMFTVFFVFASSLFFISTLKYEKLSTGIKIEIEYKNDIFIRGILLYVLINLAGYHGQKQGEHWGIFIMIIICIIGIGISTFKKLNLNGRKK